MHQTPYDVEVAFVVPFAEPYPPSLGRNSPVPITPALSSMIAILLQ